MVEIGSCGDKWCHSLGMKSHVTCENWLWDDYVFSWTAACEGARLILLEIQAGNYECSKEELLSYKDSLRKMENYIV